MPIKRVRVIDIPSFRDGKSRTLNFPEWRGLVKAIKNGIKPFEAIEIDLKETVDKIPEKMRPKNSNFNFCLQVKRYIKKEGLMLDCYTRAGIVYVVGR